MPNFACFWILVCECAFADECVKHETQGDRHKYLIYIYIYMGGCAHVYLQVFISYTQTAHIDECTMSCNKMFVYIYIYMERDACISTCVYAHSQLTLIDEHML